MSYSSAEKHRDAQLRDISLRVKYSLHQSKNVRHRFQNSDYRVLQFSGFASSIFLFYQHWSHQSYQLILQKRRHGNLNDIHFQNVCTNVLACTVPFYQSSTFRLAVVPSSIKVVYSLTSVLFFTLIASHQINQTFSVQSKRWFILKASLPCDSISKSISFCNIFTHSQCLFTTFVKTSCSVDRI